MAKSKVLSGSNSRYLNGAIDEFVIFDQALDADAVRTLWNGGRSVHLTLDETSGTRALDSSPNGNDGTLIGTSNFASDFPGIFGRAIDLRGVNGRVSIANSANLPAPGDTFTVASWVRVDDWDAPNGIIASYQFNGLRWNIGLKGSEGALFVGAEFGANRMAAFDVTQLPDGQFVHIAVVYSAIAGVENVYFDGEPMFEAYDAAFLFTNGGGFTLGSRTRNGVTSVYLDGILDDFALFDRRLSLTELQQVMAEGAGSLVSGGPAGGGAAAASASAIEAAFALPVLVAEEDDPFGEALPLRVDERRGERFDHERAPLLVEPRARRTWRSRWSETFRRTSAETEDPGTELDYARLAAHIFAEDAWDDGQWEVGSGKWEVESGKWKVESGKWKVESGKWEVGSGKWKVESGKQVVAEVARPGADSRRAIAARATPSEPRKRHRNGSRPQDLGAPGV